MPLIQIIILAVVQGLAELLPVSSSAHVIVAEKLMGLDPTSPQMTLLLVMLHSGTMLAVIVYFWNRWRETYFKSTAAFKQAALLIIVATLATAVIGELLIKTIEKVWLGGNKAQVEELFGHLELIAPALAAAGLLILASAYFERRKLKSTEGVPINLAQALFIGAVQGLCLPFRGFSRSGATISTAMLSRVPKLSAETFSFALAVVLTPAAIGREALRVVKAQHLDPGPSLASAMLPSLLGALFAFFAGLLALKWLSRWLEGGRWYVFGIYCLFAAAVVATLHSRGY